MSTHHKCDRCGADSGVNSGAVVNLTVANWKGDGTLPADPRDVRVITKVDMPDLDHDEPDLCQACKGELLMQAGAKLYREARGEALLLKELNDAAQAAQTAPAP